MYAKAAVVVDLSVMYELIIKTDFSAAHNLRGYEGKCERLHGHNWHIEVCVEAETLNELEMAIDFKVLKAETGKIMEKFDHRYLNEVEPFDKINTTAENIARIIFKGLAAVIDDGNLRVSKVRAWESQKAAAAYYE
ncbi:6-carboxy-5,6,7,8-tetrahydropterin synthase @ Folate biosynthesis protein PTPS-III, catalyzes a reaction that bypasses dihydroneopterin aldolase (FolB) [hydrothermal vent metagenome]|uniref:6-carboxy-5,6,7,8-tetrahydropterin synthase @ Folate biosynthesis protein PTPS-III, catalyzes a reaction that bypasses dihydroneopterin aldolase (FolB) n=1 Tax=hydrothermal vent metagenome TaxID=652676 RepID=A0A3B0VEA2_9ZZZZ